MGRRLPANSAEAVRGVGPACPEPGRRDRTAGRLWPNPKACPGLACPEAVQGSGNGGIVARIGMPRLPKIAGGAIDLATVSCRLPYSAREAALGHDPPASFVQLVCGLAERRGREVHETPRVSMRNS